MKIILYQSCMSQFFSLCPFCFHFGHSRFYTRETEHDHTLIDILFSVFTFMQYLLKMFTEQINE